jgi:DNA mismatch repair protein MutL
MAKIKLLAPEVRDKIAAGEVITRPNSVIKELIENSLDAKARRVDIEIEEGGKKKCLVNDDGLGMAREDALLAIERYATSKITDIEDIEKIRSYGFRGEALASICQVSFFDLETSNGTEGTRIEVSGGAVKGVFDSHRPMGTRIKVTGLFFNLPARLKFLKSSDWERRLITETVRVYGLISFNVNFVLAETGRTLINLSAVNTLEKRLKLIYPKIVTDHLIKLDQTTNNVVFNGYFSHRDFQYRHALNYLYVNYRPVRYPRLYRTIMETYENPKNIPAFLLNIIIDPSLVDVNIHPGKTEVRFRDERYVADLLSQAIKKHVFNRSSPVDFRSADQKTDTAIAGSVRSEQFVQEPVIAYDPAPKKDISPARESEEFWQLHNTYILAQTKSGLIMVDQHVAHERIIYESVLKSVVHGQRLLFPITLELTPEAYEIYVRTKPVLEDLGMEFKEFSARTVIIDSLPSDARINREDIANFFNEIGALGDLMKEKSEIAKILACKAAIKAGERLSVVEMQSLIDQLFACENPYICPHGRPIVIKFSLEDLAARFGR